MQLNSKIIEMKKISLLFVFTLIAAGAISAQLVNQGGTITIQPGATLVVQSDITNTTGSIVNNGTIEVTGNFTNDATVTSGAASKVIFKGDSDSNFKSNGADFAIIENNKSDGDVLLTDAASATEAINFTGTSNFKLGDFDFTLGDDITMTNGSAAAGFFETDGMGSVVKMTDAAGTFEFDLGTGTDFTPLSAVHTGTYVAGTSQVSAQTTDGAHPDRISDSDDYLTRYWTVENNLASPSIAMTGTYASTGDEVGTAGDMVGARWEDMEWEFGTGAQSGSTVSATTTAATSEMTGMNSYSIANAKIFLDGPYNAGTETMTTLLNSGGVLETHALTSPYGDGVSVASGFFTANPTIVDWVYLETRNSTTPGTIEGGSSAFLKSDGSIVGIDGVSNPTIKDGKTSGFLIVKHRNHLSVSTPASIVLDGSTPMQDFTSEFYTAFGTHALRVRDTKRTMWSGDANGSGSVVFSGAGTDVSSISVDVFVNNPANSGTFNPLLPFAGYHNSDLNLSGQTIFSGSGTDVSLISVPVFLHPLNTAFNPLLPFSAQLPE